MVPAVRPVVDAVMEQTLMRRVAAQVRFVQERIQHGKASLPVAVAIRVTALLEKTAETEQALRSNGGGGAIDGLEVVVGIGRTIEVVAELVQQRRTGVPVR